MLDRERVLTKIDELEGYLKELLQIKPGSFDEYRTIEKRRACERLLQLLIECMIDICGLLVSGLRLGLPGEEDDLFEKLEQRGIISALTGNNLRRMKAFRNILVHEYGRIDDRLVYEILSSRLGDIEAFRVEIVTALKSLT